MYLGVEIGGTKLQIGVGAGDGTLLGLWRETVHVAAGPEGIRRQISGGVPELLSRAGLNRSQVKGVGIGFGGPVDDGTRTIIKSHQIEGWDGFPLADWISEIVGAPTVLGNDADVAGLAEALFGAGKGLSPIFYITIGSGIGGGFIINGEIYRGCGRGAAEIGHLKVEDLGCLTTWFPLEEHCSGWAIAKKANETLWSDHGYTSSLFRLVTGGKRTLTTEDVARTASQGDAFARSILDGAWEKLAHAICHVIALLCPRRIIIGGGVSLMGHELLFTPLRQKVARSVFTPFAHCYEIVPAILGEEVVVHGALALARRRLPG
jgi:glucokinase